MQGKRVANYGEACRSEGEGFIPGTYWPGRELSDGRIEWWIVMPDGVIGSLSPDKHTVTEHEDGTITVSPSILSTQAAHGHDWHGYLERGVWREV
jgi:hypothetical protein